MFTFPSLPSLPPSLPPSLVLERAQLLSKVKAIYPVCGPGLITCLTSACLPARLQLLFFRFLSVRCGWQLSRYDRGPQTLECPYLHWSRWPGCQWCSQLQSQSQRHSRDPSGNSAIMVEYESRQAKNISIEQNVWKRFVFVTGIIVHFQFHETVSMARHAMHWLWQMINSPKDQRQ